MMKISRKACKTVGTHPKITAESRIHVPPLRLSRKDGRTEYEHYQHAQSRWLLLISIQPQGIA